MGESHNESRARREAEKQFIYETIGSRDYWTENEFPDLQQQIGARDKREQDEKGGADLMEYRSVHGAALLIAESERITQAAGKIGLIAVDQLPPEKAETFTRLVAKFDTSVEDLRLFAERIERSVASTTSAEVDRMVAAIFQRIQNTCQAYSSSSRATISELKVAAQTVATRLADLSRLLPALEKASGMTSSGGDAKALGEQMRTQRSSFMGLASVYSRQTGVWKIGNAHLEDLLSGRAKVDMSKANFVTKEAFNAEFERWQRSKGFT